MLELFFMLENGGEFPNHLGVSFALAKIFSHLLEGGDKGGLIDQSIDHGTIFVANAVLLIALVVVMIMVVMMQFGNFWLFAIFIWLRISLHQSQKDAMILPIDIIAFSRLYI